MKRRRISSTERAGIFLNEHGICHLCHGRISVGEAWDISHEIPLELGGDDRNSNLRIAHRKCHREHTAKIDAPNIARAKRRERKHIGAKTSARPMPCGRNSPFRKKISGEVVRR